MQYARWLGNVVRGDLGWSETDSRPVTEALLSRLPATAELALLAILPLVLVGISLWTPACGGRAPDLTPAGASGVEGQPSPREGTA